MNEIDRFVDKIITGAKTATCVAAATVILFLLTMLAVYSLFLVLGFEVIKQ